MATSFDGWGGAWGGSWGPITVDPNAMVGLSSFTFSAVGSLTSTSSGSNLPYWNGTAWIAKPLKYWNGSIWQTKTLKRWNGNIWL